MKKITTLIVLVTMLIALIGCNSNKLKYGDDVLLNSFNGEISSNAIRPLTTSTLPDTQMINPEIINASTVMGTSGYYEMYLPLTGPNKVSSIDLVINLDNYNDFNIFSFKIKGTDQNGDLVNSYILAESGQSNSTQISLDGNTNIRLTSQSNKVGTYKLVLWGHKLTKLEITEIIYFNHDTMKNELVNLESTPEARLLDIYTVKDDIGISRSGSYFKFTQSNINFNMDNVDENQLYQM